MEVCLKGCLDMMMLCACCLSICILKHTHTRARAHAHTPIHSNVHTVTCLKVAISVIFYRQLVFNDDDTVSTEDLHSLFAQHKQRDVIQTINNNLLKV